MTTNSATINYSYGGGTNVSLFRRIGTGAQTLVTTFGSGTDSGSYNVTGLASNTTYRFELRNGSTGTSTLFDTADCRTLPPQPSGTISCASSTVNSVTVTYSYTNGTNVSLFRGSTLETTFGSGNRAATNYVDTGLSPNTAYTYYLRNGNTSTSTQLATVNATSDPQCRTLSDSGLVAELVVVSPYNAAFDGTDYIINPGDTFQMVPRIRNTGAGPSGTAYLQVPNPSETKITNTGTGNTSPQSASPYGYDSDSTGAGCGRTFGTFCPAGKDGWYWGYGSVAAGGSNSGTFAFTNSLSPGERVCFIAYASPISSASPTTADPSTPVCVRAPAVPEERFPFLNTTRGSIHAGGGIEFDVRCVSGDDRIIGARDRSGGTASKTDYVASSGGGAIDDFGTLGNPLNFSLLFSNVSGSEGRYGKVCRPNLPDKANNYTGTVQTISATGTTGASQVQTALSSTSNNRTLIKYTGGALTIPSDTVVNGQKTLYVTNGTLTLNGRLYYPSTGVLRTNLPSLGVIVNGGLNVSGTVPNISGLYWIRDGVNTCTQGINAAACQTTLTLRGLIMANNFRFNRTATSGVTGLREAERFGESEFGLLYLATPPVFSGSVTPGPRGPAEEGEKAPLF